VSTSARARGASLVRRADEHAGDGTHILAPTRDERWRGSRRPDHRGGWLLAWRRLTSRSFGQVDHR
jgi:hypothetical protein